MHGTSRIFTHEPQKREKVKKRKNHNTKAVWVGDKEWYPFRGTLGNLRHLGTENQETHTQLPPPPIVLSLTSPIVTSGTMGKMEWYVKSKKKTIRPARCGALLRHAGGLRPH